MKNAASDEIWRVTDISYVQSIKHSPKGMSVLLFPIILKVKDLSKCLACCRLNFCLTKITCWDCQNQQSIDMFDSEVKKNWVDKETLCHTPKKICLEKSFVPPVARKSFGSSYPRHAQKMASASTDRGLPCPSSALDVSFGGVKAVVTSGGNRWNMQYLATAKSGNEPKLGV